MPDAKIAQLAVAHAEYLDYRAGSRLIAEAGAYPGRAALGAGRWALLRRLLGENLLLALAGGTLGLLVAKLGLRAILAAEPGARPRVDEITLELPVLALARQLAIAGVETMDTVVSRSLGPQRFQSLRSV
jgi:hypothetical protein